MTASTLRQGLRIYWLLAGCLSLSLHEVGAQQNLTGRVVDTLGHPIAHARVSYKVGEGLPESYVFTSGDGKFVFFWKGQDSLTLGIAALGFEPRDTVLKNPVLRQTPPLEIQLRESPLVLDEVEVTGKSAIYRRKDTVEIRVDAYINGAEQTAEEVLGKLPGVEVLEDGEIRVRGRRVRKVLIEGDDLFDQGYRLLTRNLNADVIERVEVLNRYQDNPLLRDIRPTEAIALNIGLKADVKGSLSGRMTLGAGAPGVYDSQANAIYVRHRTKAYGLASGNGVGRDPSGDLYNLIQPAPSASDSYPGDGERSPVVLAPGLPPAPVREGYLGQNHAGMGVLHAVLRPGRSLQLTAQFLGTSGNQRIRHRGVELFEVGETPFRNTEASLHLLKKGLVSGQWTAVFTPRPDHRLKWTNRWSRARLLSRNNVRLNALENNLLSGKETERMDSRLEYTWRLDSLVALQFRAHLIREYEPAELNLDGFQFGRFLSLSADSRTTRQHSASSLDFRGFQLEYLRTQGPSRWVMALEHSIRRESLGGALVFPALVSAPIILAGWSGATRTYHGLRCEYRRELRGFSLRAKMEALQTRNILYRDERHRSRYLALVPHLGLHWQDGQTHKVSASYSYDFTDLALSAQRSAPLLSGYRTLRRGLGQYAVFRSHRVMARYVLGNWGDPSMLQSTFLYRKEPSFQGELREIDADYTVTAARILKGRSLVSWSTTLDQYLPWLMSNLKVNTSFTYREYPTQINGLYRRIRNKTFSVGPELRSVFNGPFNFHGGVLLSFARTMGAGAGRSQWMQAYLDLEYRANSPFLGQLKSELYAYPDTGANPVLFSDFQFSYTPEGRRTQWHLYIQNLWGVRRLESFSIENTGSYTSAFQLRPRSILLKVMLRL